MFVRLKRLGNLKPSTLFTAPAQLVRASTFWLPLLHKNTTFTRVWKAPDTVRPADPLPKRHISRCERPV